jgi:cobalamin biosynthetic protein CobC
MIFRSFGKFFGLAGLRLGFAIGAQIIINRFRTALGPWSVAGPALRVGAIALRDEEWIGNTKNRLTDMRNKIENLLSRNGFEIVGATDLFVTSSNIESRKIANSLAQNYILVRTFDGNPHWIRFGLPANLTEYDRLEKALAQVG